jgi:hypothetical protein
VLDQFHRLRAYNPRQIAGYLPPGIGCFAYCQYKNGGQVDNLQPTDSSVGPTLLGLGLAANEAKALWILNNYTAVSTYSTGN